MRRREFIAGLAGSLWSFASRAETKLRRVGVLRVGPPPPTFIEALRKGLRDLGYVEGQNLVIEHGFGQSVEELPHLAADLVRRNVDVLVASGTPAVLPARDVSKTVPVVFVAAIDPVSTGVVDSLARPGGNVTGLTAIFADLNGKRLELLKEIVPSLSRVAFVSRLTNPGHQQYVQELERAAKTLSVQLQIIAIRSPNDFGEAFRSAAGAEGLIQIDDAMLTAHREQLIPLALRHRLPGIYGARLFVDLGGLASLGADYPDLYWRAAHYIDAIFKGAKPSDLPVQQPTKFELIINLNTASALGLTIPPSLLARADEVIE
jgi:putative ABC transport system substrate-binding protein